MTTCLLISLYVAHEKSFDEFHARKDNIYRVRHDRYTNHQLTRQFSNGPMGIGDDLKRNFPEVVRFTRLNPGNERTTILAKGDTRFKEGGVFFASEDFFKIFSYELVKGTDSTVLRDPFTMVISESLAKKYFGDEDPVGKTLKANGKHEYVIDGVFRDTPGNTHLKFDALFSFISLHKILGPVETEDLMSNWGWEGNWTYVELREGTDIRRLSEKIQVYVDKETAEFSKLYNEQMSFVFQPLTSIHLNSDVKNEIEPAGSEVLVNFLMLIAAFILVISWINYVNLSTAKAVERAKEVGVRKILGTKRTSLLTQFIGESGLLMLMAFAMTFVLAALLLPSFSSFVERDLTLDVFKDLSTWLVILLVFTAGAVCAGFYPAVLMSGFRPAMVLKGNFRTSHKGTNMRRALVTFQFVASIILITGTIAMYSQMKYMQERPLGMNRDNVLVVNGPHVHDDDQTAANQVMYESLASWPFIESIALSTDVPGHAVQWATIARLDGKGEDEHSPVRSIQCDENFLGTYGLTLVAGRNFLAGKSDEWKSAMVNESAMKVLGVTEPAKIIGRELLIWGNKLRIVGVVRDYHHESLKKSVDQLVYVCDRSVARFFSLKFADGTDLQQLLQVTSNAFDKAFPKNTFHYFFMDDYFERQYRSEVAFNKITAMFATLATLISCLGLFGLSSYMIVQRTKEIGIRKVLGATARQIVVLVSKEYLAIVLVSMLIAWPLAYYLVMEWLNGFAYRFEPGLAIYLVPGIGALLVAFMTIAAQSIKASYENPVKSLRSE